MPFYRHQISGVFEQLSQAHLVRAALINAGVPALQISISRRLARSVDLDQAEDGSEVAQRVLVMACIGAVAGILLASLAELGVMLLAQPLRVADEGLSSMRWLASGVIIGMLVGAIAGARMGDAQVMQTPVVRLPARIYAWLWRLIGNKPIQLCVITYSSQETAMVAAVMHLAAQDYCDLKLVSS
ncbi:hypothetical protein Q9292_08635 [Methylophilus sp. VKM B-3414]|uniref:hypothetical protein n=1 Tax=Methylophilus sp. VKM B-3414 TaxID=3076121 RepID=UPI0028C54066|nr:hypothetical protein [Methylophilus sp. VKM B-3414]MDT7849673.1 hypothetical protein [Methylophilus sp. VKM B-3414]